MYILREEYSPLLNKDVDSLRLTGDLLIQNNALILEKVQSQIAYGVIRT